MKILWMNVIIQNTDNLLELLATVLNYSVKAEVQDHQPELMYITLLQELYR